MTRPERTWLFLLYPWFSTLKRNANAAAGLLAHGSVNRGFPHGVVVGLDKAPGVTAVGTTVPLTWNTTVGVIVAVGTAVTIFTGMMIS